MRSVARPGSQSSPLDLPRPDRATWSKPTRLDLLQAAIMLMALATVWRIQSLIPILNVIKIQYLAPVLALAAFLADKDPRRALRKILNPLSYKLFGIGVLILLSVPTSLWPGLSLRFFTGDHSKTLLLMTLIAASVRSRSDLERFALMHVVGAVYYSFYTVTNFGLQGKSARLGSLIYYDSNDLALLLVCTIPLCVYFLRPGVKLAYRLAATPALGLLMYTLVKSGSRGGFVAFVVCSAYLLFSFTAVPARIRAYAVAALLAFITIFGGTRYWRSMKTILSPKKDYNWTAPSGRKEVWTRGIGYMTSHPFTGVGARAFPLAEGHISFADLQAQGQGMKWSAAHNSFVEIGAELGVFGLGLFVAAIGGSWRGLRQIGKGKGGGTSDSDRALAHALAGALVSYCVAGFFLAAAYSAFLYTIFGMIIALMKLVSIGASTDLPTGASPALAVRGAALAGDGARSRFRHPVATPALRFPQASSSAPRTSPE